MQLFAELGFEHLDPDALISELPLAQRQLVEIAKAFSHNPQVLILDEGTSALSIHDVKLVFEVMRRMRDEGRSVIFISHRMSEVEEIADTLTIFRDGEDVGSFPMGSVSEEEMVQLMIGRKLEQVFPPKPADARHAAPAAGSAKPDVGNRRCTTSAAASAKARLSGLAGWMGRDRANCCLRCSACCAVCMASPHRRQAVNISSPAAATKQASTHGADPRRPQDRGADLADVGAR